MVAAAGEGSLPRTKDDDWRTFSGPNRPGGT